MTDTCTKPGCESPVKARGLCATDYRFAYRHGTLPPKAPAPDGCSVDNCPGAHEARGLCQKHYFRYYMRGTTELTEPWRAMSIEARFRSKVRDEPCACGDCDGCLRWKAGKIGQGYGSFYVNGKRVLAHRFAYELEVGPIPEFHQVDHVRERGCRHRDCVKKEHLEPVSLEENLRRAPAGKRAQNGKWQKAFFAEHAAERFWAKADKSGGPEAHWPWQAFTDQDGNAKTWWQGSTHMAREVAWTLAYGPVPDGMTPEQECGRGDCVNPVHLILISRKTERARRAAKARAGKLRRSQEAASRGAGNGPAPSVPGQLRPR